MDHLLSMEKETFCLVLEEFLPYKKTCMGLSLSWLERTPDKREVDGSSPFRPTIHGDLAQLGERLPCTQEVRGSIPLVSTKKS